MMTDSLSDRLKAMGVNLGKPREEAPPASKTISIDQVVQGAYYTTVYGETFVTKTIFAPDYSHGTINPFRFTDLDVILQWGKLTPTGAIDLRKVVFLDTETSGLAGGAGTFAFLIGLGSYTNQGFEVIQLFMKDPSLEPGLLAALIENIGEREIVVTFNGKSFDLPLINTRMLLNGLTSPMPALGHIDLLHLARRIWRDRLVSRALGDLEKEIMGFHRTQEEVPGYLIPQYYFDYLRTGDATPLGGVMYHNAVDIMSLAALFAYTGNILTDPLAGNIPTLDIAAIARLHEDLGHLEMAASLYKQCLENGMPDDFYVKTLERFASMRRKQEKYDLAATLWQEAAQAGYFPALIQLAKYHEHTTRDFQAAMACILTAQQLLAAKSMPRYLRQMYEEDLQKRQLRLQKKIARQSPVRGE